MSTNAVDWSTLTADPATSGAVDTLAALAAGFDTQVPAVLLPLRVETRFATVEVPDDTDHVGELLQHIDELSATLKRLQARRYATTLVGTVKEKKEFKTKVEAPLVQAASADLDQVSAAIEAMRPHLEQPLLTGSSAQSKRLASALPAARAALEAGVAALSRLRSEYQRDQQVGRLEAQRADVELMFRTIEQRVAPTVRRLPSRGVLVAAGPTRTVHQLLVRIYPEPLAVDSHEDGLTDLELSDGAVFWTATTAAGADEQLRLGAWRALCIGRSTRRAAWIARVTEPAEPEETAPTPGAEAAAAINAALTVMEKRLSGLDAEAPVIRERLLERRPIDLRPRDAPPAKSLGARQISAVEKALQVMESSVETTVALAEAALAPIQARLQTVLAAVEGLAKTFVDVPAEWARRLGLLGRAVRRIPVEPAPEPEIPGVGHRTGTWTRAASSSVLPHRFAVFTVNDGMAVKVGAGRPIPPELALGLDPGTDTFSLEDGLLVVPDTIRWMTDFDEAEAKGMALRLTLTPEEAARGFDELLVLGLSDGDAADGEGRLTAMLEAHHYTGEGLSLLSVGTPTNNTEDDQAGFSTADDPDAAYAIERGPSLVAAQDSDGGRLAAALGIAPDVVAHVAGASATDAKDAQLANRVLYPGTVGHALEELVPGLVSRDARDRLRSYALGDVSGRSLLPAVRVDDQPYALLPTLALSRVKSDLRDSGLGSAAAEERAKQQRFEDTLLALFRHLHRDWSDLRRGADGRPGVKHVQSPEVGEPGFDAQQHFLGMLGLEASSVGAGYRFSVNVADRGEARGQPDLGLGFGVPPKDGSTNPAANFGPFALMQHLAGVLRLAFDVPAAVPPRHPTTGGVPTEWQPVYERIRTSRAYGLRLLTGLRPLLGQVATAQGTGTGRWILNLLDLSLDQLRARTEQDLSNVGLAELLVRHALLAEARRAAAEILVTRGLLTDAEVALLGTSSIYQTWSNGTLSQTSSWGLLFETTDQLVRVSGSGVGIPPDLQNRLMTGVVAQQAPPVIAEHRAAVQAFAALPPARVAALTREHLDLSSYRLDAWVGGLAHRRLRRLREVRPRGAQVGAYGWLENLRPAPTVPAATGVPAALADLPGRPLMRDLSGEGFIQTPLPSHAVTASILRAAYRSQTAEGSFGNEMSVNLSSGRVRVALSLIDGVRAGNDLGALLGYRLERFLHEYYARPDTPHIVELDAAIFPLRRAYPTVAAVNPDTAAVTEPTRFVVDGLALVRAVLGWVEEHAAGATGTLFQTLASRPAGYPWGTKPGALPLPTEPDKLTGVLRGIDAIADALDALGDLTTSETVYQLARGNHARAAAVLSALAEGTAIPHPEVTETPRTGLPVSHKLILQLPAVAAVPAAGPPGWDAVPLTARAALEPSVNHWLGGLLGDPAQIRVRLASDSLAPGAALPEVSVAELGLQPLDLVALLADGFDAAVGSLTARVLDRLRPADLPPDQPGVVVSDGPQTTVTDAWRIEPARAAAWGPSIRSITDVAPLLEAAVDLLGTSKPATAADYAAPEFTATAGDGIDVADLSVRVRRLLDGAIADVLRLARLLADDPTLDPASLDDDDPAVWLGAQRAARPDGGAWLDGVWAGRDAWLDAARAAQAYGIRVGLPRRYLSRVQVSTELLQSAEVAFLDLAARCRAASATLAAASDPRPASAWTQAAKDLLGDGLTLVPRVGLDPVRADLQTALDARLVGPDEVDGWLEGAAAVRRGAADLADVQVFAEALGRGATTGAVAQLPHSDDDPWVGGALPDRSALTGKVSVVIYGSGNLPAVGSSGTALLVDEWSETVPYREEVTGVALHYDQPDATAPQAILLAVPPVRDQAWTLADFAATLHDTLELARNRTVEVEHIGASRYGQLLPLLVGEVVPNAAHEDVAGDRVILDFHQNNP